MYNYTPQRPSAVAKIRKENRKEAIKQIVTVIVALPVLWFVTVLYLCI